MRFIPQAGLVSCLVLCAGGCTGKDDPAAAPTAPVARVEVDPAAPDRSVTCTEPLTSASVVSGSRPPKPPYASTPEEALGRVGASMVGRADSFPDAALYRPVNFERLPREGQRQRSVTFAGYRSDGSVFAVLRIVRYADVPHWHLEGSTSCHYPSSVPDADIQCAAGAATVHTEVDDGPEDNAPQRRVESDEEAIYQFALRDEGVVRLGNHARIEKRSNKRRAHFAVFRPDGSVASIVTVRRTPDGMWAVSDVESCSE